MQRFVLLGVSLLCLGAPIAMFACSSATTVTEEVQDSGTTALPDDGQGAVDEPPPVSPPATDPDAAALGDGGVTDAAPTGAVSTEGDGGIRCQAGSLREAEGNNDVATANVVPGQTLTFCGRLPANDVDVVKFTMPNVVNNFFFNIEAGNVRVQPSLDGQDFNFNSNNYPFKAGGIYALRISSQQPNVDYRIKITIEQ